MRVPLEVLIGFARAGKDREFSEAPVEARLKTEIAVYRAREFAEARRAQPETGWTVQACDQARIARGLVVDFLTEFVQLVPRYERHPIARIGEDVARKRSGRGESRRRVGAAANEEAGHAGGRYGTKREDAACVQVEKSG